MSFELNHQEWLTTPEAAEALGVSHHTLRRWANRDQILKAGEHFMYGPHRNSSKRWRVAAIKQLMLARGVMGYSTSRPDR